MPCLSCKSFYVRRSPTHRCACSHTTLTQHTHTHDFRPWLRYHLPIADSPDPAVRYGDAAIDACAHGHRHTLVLTAWHHAAIAAYGAAV